MLINDKNNNNKHNGSNDNNINDDFKQKKNYISSVI